MNGILVAMTVMVATLASKGQAGHVAHRAGHVGHLDLRLGPRLPSAWGTPGAMAPVRSVAAQPVSIYPQAMSWARPSSAVDLVSLVIACLVAV